MKDGTAWIVAGLILLTPACSHAVRQAPATAAVDSEGPPAVPAAPPRPAYRPLHKGYADLSTGLYFREDDDLFLNTAMPLVLRRTYNSGDGYSRQFGVNTTHNGEWWIYGDGDPRIPWGDLMLANGGRIHFKRISPGNTQADAVLRHDATPTEFNGALLSWNGSDWVMKFTDGSLAVFHDCQTKNEHCSLLERRDAQGHRIEYVRDTSQRLLRIESESQSISFEYDTSGRIARVFDSSGHVVAYSYDQRGRLVLAISSDGVIRSYAYDNHDGLIAIREPGRIVQNWFDESGHWIRQEVRRSDDDRDPYVATARYVVVDRSVVRVDFDEGDGLEIRRYNPSHYAISETFDAEGAAPATFRYDRDETTNVVRGVTLLCGRQAEAVALPVPPTVEHDAESKWLLMRKYCLPHP
jgi:YD repeat-containing protein